MTPRRARPIATCPAFSRLRSTTLRASPPAPRAAPAPRRSRAFPASARSPRAPARGRRGRRRGGRSIGRAWRARAPRAVRSCACPARFATAMAVRKASSAGAGLAGSRFSSISPRTRCSSASNARCPVRSHVASASSRTARARSTSPARASASASAILMSRRRSERSARAEVRRRDACPRARRRRAA